jgi:hypothetical protein
MTMAKASQADLESAMKVCNALDGFEKRFWPEALNPEGTRPSFDCDDGEDAKAAIRYLLEITARTSLSRVAFGMIVVLDPRNRIVDPDADHLAVHPSRDAMLAALKAVQAEQVENGPLSAKTLAMVNAAITLADPDSADVSVVASRKVKWVMPIDGPDETLKFIAEAAPHPGGPGGAHLQQLVGGECACQACLTARDARDAGGWPIVATTMIVCVKCGNKRCPHAANHANACTRSNEPDQAADNQPVTTT